jgi:hypothetical protein
MADRQREPRRRPSVDEVFGAVLPDTTADEREPEPPTDRESWYERERPPHHDRDASD